MVSCVFPGSFDPVTTGHVHLISRASAMFDRVTVAVLINIQKKYTISVEKRIELLQAACRICRMFVSSAGRGFSVTL
jgi:pantetheine-phosphate adenylyltransferase